MRTGEREHEEGVENLADGPRGAGDRDRGPQGKPEMQVPGAWVGLRNALFWAAPSPHAAVRTKV